MENLPVLVDAAKQRANLDRLQAAAELARELSPGEPAVIETILGSGVGKWDAVKQQLVEKLGDWAAVLAEAKVVLAVKAHINNAMQRPEEVVWLLQQVDSPWIKAAYDYSHFQLQGLALADTLAVLLPHTRFIHVKDSKTMGAKWQFALPGEGTIDYRELGRLVAEADYKGDIVVEVSGQVFSRPGYDPIAAARQCYEHLRPRISGQ
jgi:inosose dehydratase